METKKIIDIMNEVYMKSEKTIETAQLIILMFKETKQIN